MARIASLAALGRDDLPLAGGKGANLGELTRAGFPVPPGYVVTTQAYDEYVDATGIRPGLLTAQDAAATRALFDAPVPAALADAIADAYRALGEGPVAVRSSATAEDLPDASFAGQQDTYLNIDGAAAVVDAVRRCWASLWTDRAVAYRARAGIDPATVSLAVVVQRLVDADAAGVLFTANPANGRRDEAVVNAAFGLGEAVVGGEVTPDEIVVAGDAVLTRTTAEKRVRT
ncbi:MAG: PEP/pyruvate-binding domain-containing protein, partial [Propioniciclava sp.]